MHCAVDQKLFLHHIKKHSAVKNRVTVIIYQKCMYEARQQSFVALVHESIHSNLRKSVMKQNGQPQWAARKAAGKRLHTSNWFHCVQLLCGKKTVLCACKSSANLIMFEIILWPTSALKQCTLCLFGCTVHKCFLLLYFCPDSRWGEQDVRTETAQRISYRPNASETLQV